MTTRLEMVPFGNLKAPAEINARGSAGKSGLDELADSIAAKGLIQPLAVREDGTPLDGSGRSSKGGPTGRYEVIERLGQGAAGVVWKARDVKLDRVVALKVLSQKDGARAESRTVDPKVVEQFWRDFEPYRSAAEQTPR